MVMRHTVDAEAIPDDAFEMEAQVRRHNAGGAVLLAGVGGHPLELEHLEHVHDFGAALVEDFLVFGPALLEQNDGAGTIAARRNIGEYHHARCGFQPIDGGLVDKLGQHGPQIVVEYRFDEHAIHQLLVQCRIGKGGEFHLTAPL